MFFKSCFLLYNMGFNSYRLLFCYTCVGHGLRNLKGENRVNIGETNYLVITLKLTYNFKLLFGESAK